MHPPQDPDRLSWKWVTGVTVALVAITVVLSLAAALAVSYYGDRYGGEAFPQDYARPLPGLPADTQLEYHIFENELEPAGPGEGERIQARERAQLETWGAADRSGARVRIPIDEAMQLVAEEGR